MATDYIITLGEKTKAILGDLAEKKCISKAEVIRRAIATYLYLSREEDAGRTIGVLGQDDEILKTVVIP
jgi:predicted transcriptional regulator